MRSRRNTPPHSSLLFSTNEPIASNNRRRDVFVMDDIPEAQEHRKMDSFAPQYIFQCEQVPISALVVGTQIARLSFHADSYMCGDHTAYTKENITQEAEVHFRNTGQLL